MWQYATDAANLGMLPSFVRRSAFATYVRKAPARVVPPLPNSAGPSSLQGGDITHIPKEGTSTSTSVSPPPPHAGFNCPICDRAYVTKSGLAKHLKTCGTRSRSECQFCGRSFSTYNGVRAHELRAHTEDYNNELRANQKRPEAELLVLMANIEVTVRKGEPFVGRMMQATGLTKDQIRHRRAKPIYQEYLLAAR
nr:unnamed protein product [Callosobruchus analis]